jgi:putative restriction endonuclease
MKPTIDHLFGRSFIGFEDSGTLIISPVAHLPSLQRMGVETERVVNVGGFPQGQRTFLDFTENSVLLRAVK